MLVHKEQPLLLPLPDPEPESVSLVVDKVPHVNTLTKHTSFPAVAIGGLTDRQVVLGWKWCHVGNAMLRRGLFPNGYVHRAHHHVLSQNCHDQAVSEWDAEFNRRDLGRLYSLVILLT